MDKSFSIQFEPYQGINNFIFCVKETRPGKVIAIINSPYSQAQKRHKVFYRAVGNRARVSLQLIIPISMMVRSTIRTLTLVVAPTLKFTAIWGNAARLFLLRIPSSRLWSCSLKIFFLGGGTIDGPQVKHEARKSEVLSLIPPVILWITLYQCEVKVH